MNPSNFEHAWSLLMKNFNSITSKNISECKKSVTSLILIVVAAIFAGDVIAQERMPNFADFPAGWATDRYEPASFSNVGIYQGRTNVLGLGIDSSTAAVSRGGQSGTFYNTQGRKYTFTPSAGAGSRVSSDLYVPASWSNHANGAVRSDMWATMVNASDVVSAYPIIGFTNYGGTARLRVWDTSGGNWLDLPTVINYDTWTRFSIELDADSSIRYYVNGSLVHTDTDTNFSTAFRDVMLQAYNFDDPALSHPPSTVIADYTAHWSNTASIVKVRPESMNGWVSGTTVSGGAYSFIDDATAPLGSGALRMTTNANTSARAQILRSASLFPLANVTNLSFATKYNAGPPHAAVGYQLRIRLGAAASSWTTLVYEPYYNGTVNTGGAWQTWDVRSGSFWATQTRNAGGSCSVTATSGGPASYTLDEIIANCPNATVEQIILNIGTWNTDYDVEVDSVRFNDVIYDMEPTTIRNVDADGFASATNCNATGPANVAFTNIPDAVAAANPGDTIRVCPGTYPTAATIALNKPNLTIIGASATKPVLQIEQPQGYLFNVTASGTTLENLEIYKTDSAGVHNLILVNGNDFTARNNLIHSVDTNAATSGSTTRGFEVANGRSGLLITGNTIHSLRQPGYINSADGTISNNVVYGTRGWVVDGGSAFINFSGNSWGAIENVACDIALINSTNLANYSPLLALSNSNSNAMICSADIGGEVGRHTSYVDNSSPLAGSSLDPHATIQAGVNGALAGGTVIVAAGTYVEDVLINKTLTVVGAGHDSTTISGVIGGDGATVRISGNNVELSGFMITREGNNLTDWDNSGLNFAGIAMQGAVTGALIRDNHISGNRTGIDVNNSGGLTIRNNIIDNNRTGMIFRNQTDSLLVTENFITNNWTLGVLFLDQSSGTNIPLQRSLQSTFTNNSISGNWYAQVADRQTGGSLPAAGQNPKNFQGNWLGTTTPVISNLNTTEPGYADQIPVVFGGTAVAPGGQPDIAGEASINLRFQPLISNGTDTNIETLSGRGINGFQGSAAVINDSTAAGWFFFDEGAVSSGAFVGGPPTAPLGVGSANLTVDANGRMTLATLNYRGLRFDSISHLQYSSHQVSGNAAAAPSLQFNVDYDLTDADTSWQGRLTFEPYMDSTVNQNSWQTWSPLNGRWWASGAPGNTLCPQASPCTWAQVLTNWPNAGIRTSDVDGWILFRAGGPTGADFVGHVDAFEIGVNTANTVIDFEPGRPTVTINQAIGQNDPTSNLTINFTATFSEAVTGFDETDVVLGGTAGATNVVVSGGPTVYNVAVSGMTGSGTVTASIADAAAINTLNAPSLPSTSTDNTVNFFTCNNIDIPDDITTMRNQQVVVPLNIDDTTGRNIISFDYTLTYNPSVMTYLGFETVGTLSNGMTITINSLTPGTLVVSGFTPFALSGSGTLINFRFFAGGTIGSSTPVNISGAMLNNNVPCLGTSNGNVEVISSTISGKVTYGNALIETPVPYTNLNAVGSVNVSSQTDLFGTYTMDGFGPGAYTVTPSKTGDVNGINSFDSARIAQHVVGLITLNSTQLLAADVSNDNFINSFDAALLAQWIVLIPNTGITGTWRFIPANRSYTDVETAKVAQDYSAILMGEVTGDWAPPTMFTELLQQRNQPTKDSATVKLPSLTAGPGGAVILPVTLRNLNHKDVIAYQFDVLFDPEVLQPEQIAADLTDTVSKHLTVVSNSPEPGVLKVAVYGVTPIDSEGILINLRFNAIGADGDSSYLIFRDLILNDGSIPVNAEKGEILISSKEDRSSINGRILTAFGEPVKKGTRVMVTGTAGTVKSVQTGEMGEYRFNDLPENETFDISVDSREHTFPPRTISIGNGLRVIDISATR